MIVYLIDWLKVSEIWNFWKSNERERNDFPKLSFLHFIPMNSNSFQHKTPEWRWHDFFHLKSKGFLKRFEFYLEIFQIIKLYATQWFSWGKIKWLLQLYAIRVGSYKESNWKSFGSILNLPFNLELFGFYSNYFSPKNK